MLMYSGNSAKGTLVRGESVEEEFAGVSAEGKDLMEGEEIDEGRRSHAGVGIVGLLDVFERPCL